MAPLARVPLEHGEVQHPHDAPAVLDEAEILAELDAERP